jgi:hypothetical protein
MPHPLAYLKSAACKVIEGLGPAQIAQSWKLSTRDAIEVIYIAIGEGLIRQSDVLFALTPVFGPHLHSCLDSKPTTLSTLLRVLKVEHDRDELELYLRLQKRRVYIHDTFELLTDLERKLHREIRSRLREKLGGAEAAWWGRGVPESVRRSCAATREHESDFSDHPYNYTTLLDLQTILDKKWKLFQPLLPTWQKNEFLKKFDRLNGIRNQVMHPVREQPPTIGDYEFVRAIWNQLNTPPWRG